MTTSPRVARRHALVALGLLVGRTLRAAGQRPAPTPRPPRLPSGGGVSPFRQKGFAGSSFGAAALDQSGCPLTVAVTGLRRSERGVIVSMELSNLSESTVSRQVVGAWVVVPDGTIRGHQSWTGTRGIEPAQHRAVELNMGATVMPDDVIVLAIQEAHSGEGATWRVGVADLEREVRGAVARERP
jgi:hypothetical protein